MQQAMRRPHVVVDMTIPRRLLTGTSTYANELLAVLQEGGRFHITTLCGPIPRRHGGLWKLWNGLRDLFWIQVTLPIRLGRIKPDILFAPSYLAPALCPCALVLTVHDTLYRDGVGKFRDRLFGLYFRLSVYAAIRRAAIICTVSEFSRNEIVSAYRVEPDRIRVTYPGVSSRYRPQSAMQTAAVRKKYNLPRPFFLFVGSWEPRKNIPRLIDAFRIFCRDAPEEYDLVLVGPTGSGEQEVRERILDLGLEDRVRTPGFVPDEDMPSLYAAAEALVFPSLGEGFGFPIIEAMACGTPVIISRASCLPEIAGAAALLIDPENPGDIAHAMRELLRAEVRTDLSRRGLERARVFTWETTARETELAFAAALGEQVHE